MNIKILCKIQLIIYRLFFKAKLFYKYCMLYMNAVVTSFQISLIPKFLQDYLSLCISNFKTNLIFEVVIFSLNGTKLQTHFFYIFTRIKIISKYVYTKHSLFSGFFCLFTPIYVDILVCIYVHNYFYKMKMPNIIPGHIRSFTAKENHIGSAASKILRLKKLASLHNKM